MVRRRVLTLLYCSVSPIPFATMTNREWGQIGNSVRLEKNRLVICEGVEIISNEEEVKEGA